MVSPAPRPARAASALAAAVAALGLAASAGVASGQNVFNPYMPYNSQYYSYIVPSIPDNMALPGAARGAMEYNSGSGAGGAVSRFNGLDRYFQEYEAEMAGRRPSRGGTTDLRRSDSSYDRSYIPNREADRRFQIQEDQRTRDYFEGEEERGRIASQRDIYFEAASRTTDPARKAAYLRVVAKLRDPKTARAMLAEIDEARAERESGGTERARAAAPSGRSATAAPATTPATATAPRAPASIAAPVNPESHPAPAVTPTPGSGVGAGAGTGAATTRPAAPAPARTTAPAATPGIPVSRPPMDSEIPSRPSTGSRAPAPPPGLAPLVAPEPIPDDEPTTPRGSTAAPR